MCLVCIALGGGHEEGDYPIIEYSKMEILNIYSIVNYYLLKDSCI